LQIYSFGAGQFKHGIIVPLNISGCWYYTAIGCGRFSRRGAAQLIALAVSQQRAAASRAAHTAIGLAMQRGRVWKLLLTPKILAPM